MGRKHKVTYVVFSGVLSMLLSGSLLLCGAQEITESPLSVKDNVDNEQTNTIAKLIKQAESALEAEDWHTRQAAVDTLEKVNDPRTTEALIVALKNGYSNIHRAAVIALGKRKDPRAVDALIAEMQDKEPFIREPAAFALGEIKDARAVQVLIAALKDKNLDVRYAAGRALGKIKDPHATEVLIAELNDEDADVRYAVAFAMREIKDPHMSTALTAALKDKDWRVRAAASDTLLDIKEAPLIAALNDKNPDVRKTAANALGDIKDTKLIQDLVPHLRDWEAGGTVASVLHTYRWNPLAAGENAHYNVAIRNKYGLLQEWTSAKNVLLRDIESEEYLVIENALYAFIGIGRHEIIPELIEKLNQKGTKTMAEAYLNCGLDELRKAAEDWAVKHGYSIKAGSGAHPVNWGSM